jgi:DNA polymerase sliding clamp subunit (PCNA homolog)
MEIKVDRDIFLKCLTHIQGVVEKKNTLPILSNVLIEAFEDKIQVSATDLDIIITEKLVQKSSKKDQQRQRLKFCMI